MPVPTLTQLFTPQSREDIVASIIQVCIDLDLPVTAWQPGSVGREIIEVIAQQMSVYSQTGSAAAGGGLLGFSTADWLTLLAFELYDVTRVPSTFGETTLVLTNNSTQGQTIVPGGLRALNVAKGTTYTCTTGGFIAADGGQLSLTISADEPGTASNANTGDISQLVTPIQGISCTNPDPLIATDGETDDALVLRCRESVAKASPNGPKDAYNFFAKSTINPTTLANVGVTRTKVVQGNGTIIVYVASAGGLVQPSDVALVNTNIQTQCVPTGFTASVASATVQNVLIAGDIYLKSGSTVSTADARNAVLARLQVFFPTIPIGGFDIGSGGTLFLDRIIGEIFQAIPGEIIQVTLTTPSGDVSVNNQNVLVCTSIGTSFTIH